MRAKVVASLGVPRVIMLPDEYLAQNVAAQMPDVEDHRLERPLRGA